jgi:hypothetical protein
VSLKALLGNGIPADWAPQRSRTETKPVPVAAPASTADTAPSSRVTPLRDAAAIARSSDRPRLNGPGDDSGPGPLRSILSSRPGAVEGSERPTPLRSLLEAIPTLIDPLPIEPLPSDVVPTDTQPDASVPADEAPTTDPAPVEPNPDERPSIRETAGSAKDGLTPGHGNVADRDGLLRRSNG